MIILVYSIVSLYDMFVMSPGPTWYISYFYCTI